VNFVSILRETGGNSNDIKKLPAAASRIILICGFAPQTLSASRRIPVQI